MGRLSKRWDFDRSSHEDCPEIVMNGSGPVEYTGSDNNAGSCVDLSSWEQSFWPLPFAVGPNISLRSLLLDYYTYHDRQW